MIAQLVSIPLADRVQTNPSLFIYDNLQVNVPVNLRMQNSLIMCHSSVFYI
jgi:hypothetical protein